MIDIPPLVDLWDFSSTRLIASIEGTPLELLWHKEPDVDSIGGMFRHAYEREWFFYELILGTEGVKVPARPKQQRHPDVERLQAEAAEAHAVLKDAILERAPAVWLARYPFRGSWGEAELTGETIVWRLIMHNSYHTGQIYYARQTLDIPGPSNVLEGI